MLCSLFICSIHKRGVHLCSMGCTQSSPAGDSLGQQPYNTRSDERQTTDKIDALKASEGHRAPGNPISEAKATTTPVAKTSVEVDYKNKDISKSLGTRPQAAADELEDLHELDRLLEQTKSQIQRGPVLLDESSISSFDGRNGVGAQQQQQQQHQQGPPTPTRIPQPINRAISPHNGDSASEIGASLLHKSGDAQGPEPTSSSSAAAAASEAAAAPDPWASLQSAYRIRDMPSPTSSSRQERDAPRGSSGKPLGSGDGSQGSLQAKPGRGRHDNQDDEVVLLVEGQGSGKSFSRTGRNAAGGLAAKPPLAPVRPPVGGAPKAGGWGKGEMAAAGTLMLGADEDLLNLDKLVPPGAAASAGRATAARSEGMMDDDDDDGELEVPGGTNAAVSTTAVRGGHAAEAVPWAIC